MLCFGTFRYLICLYQLLTTKMKLSG